MMTSVSAIVLQEVEESAAPMDSCSSGNRSGQDPPQEEERPQQRQQQQQHQRGNTNPPRHHHSHGLYHRFPAYPMQPQAGGYSRPQGAHHQGWENRVPPYPYNPHAHQQNFLFQPVLPQIGQNRPPQARGEHNFQRPASRPQSQNLFNPNCPGFGNNMQNFPRQPQPTRVVTSSRRGRSGRRSHQRQRQDSVAPQEVNPTVDLTIEEDDIHCPNVQNRHPEMQWSVGEQAQAMPQPPADFGYQLGGYSPHQPTMMQIITHQEPEMTIHHTPNMYDGSVLLTDNRNAAYSADLFSPPVDRFPNTAAVFSHVQMPSGEVYTISQTVQLSVNHSTREFYGILPFPVISTTPAIPWIPEYANTRYEYFGFRDETANTGAETGGGADLPSSTTDSGGVAGDGELVVERGLPGDTGNSEQPPEEPRRGDAVPVPRGQCSRTEPASVSTQPVRPQSARPSASVTSYAERVRSGRSESSSRPPSPEPSRRSSERSGPSSAPRTARIPPSERSGRQPSRGLFGPARNPDGSHVRRGSRLAPPRASSVPKPDATESGDEEKERPSKKKPKKR